MLQKIGDDEHHSINSVQNKIKCVFEINLTNERSSKRRDQNYQILATEKLSNEALVSSYQTAIVSEKIDGTCCYAALYEGIECLWARLDRKLNKDAGRKLKDYNRKKLEWLNSNHQSIMPELDFNYPDDLKAVPNAWKPASNVDRHPETNNIVPDANGHVPGWVPVQVDPKQYCWHHSAISDEFKLLLVLKDSGISSDNSRLVLSVEPLSNYCGKTLELIGTNVNANPYDIGDKQSPFHVLVPHGSISACGFPAEVDFHSIKSWFLNKHCDSMNGNVEGIIWKCKNEKLFKLHRHHIGLPWPLRSLKKREKEAKEEHTMFKPWLCFRQVEVMSNALQDIQDTKLSPLFTFIKNMHLKTFPSINDLTRNWKQSLTTS